MKGWIASGTNPDKGSAIVFADTRNKAKLAALRTEQCEEDAYINIRVHRVPEIDGMEDREPSDNYWLNDEIRLILVKFYNWSCVDPFFVEDCNECIAQKYCHYFD